MGKTHDMYKTEKKVCHTSVCKERAAEPAQEEYERYMSVNIEEKICLKKQRWLRKD
jgi:hypothetical protein